MADLSGYATYGSFFLVIALINAIAVLGLNLQWGQTGLFNVGVAAFVAIGAYTSALLTTPAGAGHAAGYGLPIFVGWLGAMAAAGGASLLVGLMTLRLRADYLAITTFGVAVTVGLVMQNAEHLTGGAFGISDIPRPFASLADRPLLFGAASVALVALVTTAAYVALERLVHSPWGRVLRAIREDELAAASLGKNPAHYRLQAFAIGGALMGLSGAVHAHFSGAGSSRGALLGAVLVWGLWSATGLATGALFPPEDQARAAALRIVAIGVLLAAMIVLRPRGLIGVAPERATAGADGPQVPDGAEHE